MHPPSTSGGSARSSTPYSIRAPIRVPEPRHARGIVDTSPPSSFGPRPWPRSRRNAENGRTAGDRPVFLDEATTVGLNASATGLGSSAAGAFSRVCYHAVSIAVSRGARDGIVDRKTASCGSVAVLVAHRVHLARPVRPPCTALPAPSGAGRTSSSAPVRQPEGTMTSPSPSPAQQSLLHRRATSALQTGRRPLPMPRMSSR